MRCGNLMVAILDEMQMLDQEIASPRPVAEQKLNLVRRNGIDLTPLGRRFGPAASFARMFERADFLHVITH